MLFSEVACLLQSDLQGEDVEISSMNELSLASDSQLTFAVNKKYVKELISSKAKAFLIPKDLVEFAPKDSSYIVCDDVTISMAYATKLFAPKPINFDALNAVVGEGTYIDDMAKVEKGALIGSNVTIMAGAYVGSNASIGNGTIIYPNAIIYRDCIVGNNCIVHAGTAIGGDGFGYSHTNIGEHIKIYQNGNVVIEDDVELGTNCSIDRAVFNSTIIKKGSKIDNLVHIAHNCIIGEYSILAGQTGLAGSSIMGRNTVFGAQSGVAGHLEIAPFNTFAARSGVTKSIKESGKVYAGFPLMEHRVWLKTQAKIAKLNSKKV
ncbi:MAG: UDP-3-O-[3-hydroxymyristoyl] glucosamine N-acyltransferase [Sulfurimonas sp.]|jgi:UDP-3-O-[3-hydroxymyristoyl] glucosamine N-acyltransferase